MLWSWLSKQSGINKNDIDALREWLQNNHYKLPETMNETYYELIGKSSFLVSGWGDVIAGNSKNQQEYLKLWKSAHAS